MRENQSAAWNIKRRTGCFCTLSYCKGSCSDDARYSQSNTAVLLYEYLKAQRTDWKSLYCGQCAEICGVCHKSRNQFFAIWRNPELYRCDDAPTLYRSFRASGILPWGIPNGHAWFCRKNRRQRSRPHRRGFCKNVRQLFPAGVFHHGRQCLDVYPEQFRSVCIRHPSRRKSCEAGQADALCILCRDVPVWSFWGLMCWSCPEKMQNLRQVVPHHQRKAHQILRRLCTGGQAAPHLPADRQSKRQRTARACRRSSDYPDIWKEAEHHKSLCKAWYSGRWPCGGHEETGKR